MGAGEVVEGRGAGDEIRLTLHSCLLYLGLSEASGVFEILLGACQGCEQRSLRFAQGSSKEAGGKELRR